MKRKNAVVNKKELKLYQYATTCYTCWKKFLIKVFGDKKNETVRYHCHFTGKYRGVAHSICSLRLNAPEDIFCIFS